MTLVLDLFRYSSTTWRTDRNPISISESVCDKIHRSIPRRTVGEKSWALNAQDTRQTLVTDRRTSVQQTGWRLEVIFSATKTYTSGLGTQNHKRGCTEQGGRCTAVLSQVHGHTGVQLRENTVYDLLVMIHFVTSLWCLIYSSAYY